RDEDEVCTWDWTGELRERSEFGEPRRFKFNGQNAWEPKVLHPFTQDEDILQSTQLLSGGSSDNKWSIRQEGFYHIRVDIFRETVHAEYLGPNPTSEEPNGIVSPLRETEEETAIYDLSGRKLSGKPACGFYIQNGKKILK
ncbi:MAG: hypothetical protein J6V92_03225, partial [Bacteroidaceae bacterium]|nr:hypothetical protein [Bacteroidaceae bacterium]